jgi:hypothetical protein
VQIQIQIRMDPHHIGKSDPGPHHIKKLDAHQSEKQEAVEAHMQFMQFTL